jgi:hypothetical protein
VGRSDLGRWEHGARILCPHIYRGVFRAKSLQIFWESLSIFIPRWTVRSYIGRRLGPHRQHHSTTGCMYLARSPEGRYVSGRSRYSNNSALARKLPLASTPPTTSTFPLPSNVAVCAARGANMLPVGVKVPLTGLKSSALAID